MRRNTGSTSARLSSAPPENCAKLREAGRPVRRLNTPTTLASGNGTRKQAGQRIHTGFVETVRAAE